MDIFVIYLAINLCIFIWLQQTFGIKDFIESSFDEFMKEESDLEKIPKSKKEQESFKKFAYYAICLLVLLFGVIVAAVLFLKHK